MLELRSITKKYNRVAVVNGVSFRVEPGEILGYLGPNGAGKSTTVKMLAGLVETDGGTILWGGKPVQDDILAFKKKIGYLPEQSELYPHLSGQEYLQLVGRLRLIPEATLSRRIEGLMELLGLSVDMYLPISSYSKGMGQKVLMAGALLHNPDILLLDEPLSGLDVTTAMIFKDILSQLSAQGKVIIYSSHILEVVEKLCTRVVIIDRGKILADDSVHHLSRMMSLPSLNSIFSELIQQQDTTRIAERFISIIQTG